MIEIARPEPFLIADSHALDLLNSVASPWGADIEWLGNGQDFLVWLEQVGMVPPDVSTRFREKASSGGLDDIAAEARELREWFRGFVASHAGRRLTSAALAELDRINRLLGRDETYRQIEARRLSDRGDDPDTPALQWRQERYWHASDTLLMPLAQAIGDLVCHADFARVKNCEGSACTLWFHDISKNHTRRWCSMRVCGNRAKAAAHRAKKRSAGSQPNQGD